MSLCNGGDCRRRTQVTNDHTNVCWHIGHQVIFLGSKRVIRGLTKLRDDPCTCTIANEQIVDTSDHTYRFD